MFFTSKKTISRKEILDKNSSIADKLVITIFVLSSTNIITICYSIYNLKLATTLIL